MPKQPHDLELKPPLVQQCAYYIPDSNTANTNIKNIKNDAPNTIKANFDVCPLIIEMIEVIKPIQAINKLIIDGTGSGNLAIIVLKKSRKKSVCNDIEINKNLLIIFCHSHTFSNLLSSKQPYYTLYSSINLSVS